MTSESTRIWTAVNNGDLHAVKSLLAEIDKPCGEKLTTPLIEAVLQPDPDLCYLLLKHKANVDGVDMEGNTALMHAVRVWSEDQSGRVDAEEEVSDDVIVRKLMRNRANINAVNNDGLTILHMMVWADEGEVICTLISRMHASPDVHDKLGRTPLMMAAELGNSGTVGSLIMCGAKHETKGANGFTALHYACNGRRGARDVVRVLLCEDDMHAGSNACATGDMGHTAMHSAARVDVHIDIARALVEAGASISAKIINCGSTPLHIAAAEGAVEQVCFLIERRADVWGKTRDGSTALELATAADQLTTTNATKIHHGPLPQRTAVLQSQPPLHAVVDGFHETPERAASDWARCMVLLEQEMEHMRCVAFAMGIHPRLGDGSRVRVFDEEIVRIVWETGSNLV